MVNVCVPVLKRYDLLRKLLESLKTSTVVPSAVYIMNNGMDREKAQELVGIIPYTVVINPSRPLGVAESWNWFIKNVDEERVITNDDVEFAPDSLSQMVASPADLAWAAGFSCFLIRDTCVAKLGLFDEDISPGFGYFEDEDYLQRLDGHGTRAQSVRAENVDCGVKHFHSATFKGVLREDVSEYCRRFGVARANYIRKWNIVDDTLVPRL